MAEITALSALEKARLSRACGDAHRQSWQANALGRPESREQRKAERVIRKCV